MLCAQERSLPPKYRAYAYTQVQEMGYTGNLTTSDPEFQHITGGVGTLMTNMARHEAPIIHTADFQQAMETGGVPLSMAVLPNDSYLLVVNMYGWVNAHNDHVAASRTQHLVKVIRQELRAQGNPPALVVGDINADPQDIDELQDWISSGARVDPGAIASSYPSGNNNEATCHVYQISQGTRRVFIFCNK